MNAISLIKKQQDKTFLSFSLDKKIRTIDKKTKYLNYNKLNNSNQRCREKELNVNQTYMFKIL